MMKHISGKEQTSAEGTRLTGRPGISNKSPPIMEHMKNQRKLDLKNDPEGTLHILREHTHQIYSTIQELQSLDVSLEALFNDAPNTSATHHEELVHFRSRVARRLSRYGVLAKRLNSLVDKAFAENSERVISGQIEEIDSTANDGLRNILQHHLKAHQNYKSHFANWWQRTERTFHTMRMANYVCSLQENRMKKTTESSNTEKSIYKTLPAALTPEKTVGNASRYQSTSQMSLEEGKKLLLQSEHPTYPDNQKTNNNSQLLSEARDIMMKETKRMQATHNQLKESSSTMQRTDSTYNAYELRMSRARSILKAIRKRSATDTELIWFSFIFFLCCCAFVILRRLGISKWIIWVIYTIIHQGLYICISCIYNVSLALNMLWDNNRNVSSESLIS